MFGIVQGGMYPELRRMSVQQLTDPEFPPSPRKKRHLALKWATGGALAIAVAAHVVFIRTLGPDSVQAVVASAAAALVLVAALSVHVWVGAKSLVADLGWSKRLMWLVRMLVVAAAILAACLVIAGIAWG